MPFAHVYGIGIIISHFYFGVSMEFKRGKCLYEAINVYFDRRANGIADML